MPDRRPWSARPCYKAAVQTVWDLFYFNSVFLVFLQAAWSLKTRALTEMVYVDEIDVDQEGIAEMMLDENSIAQVARKWLSQMLDHWRW